MNTITERKMTVMWIKLKVLSLFFLSFLVSANNQQTLTGTSNINGIYAGEYSIIMRAAPVGVVLGYGISKPQWQWNFDNNTAIVQGTTLSVGFNYELHDLDNIDPEGETLYFDNNGDGTYTLHYSLQIYNPGLGNPMASASTTFRITKNDKILDIIAIDKELATPDGIIGTQIPNVFPLTIEPDMHGIAYQLAADSNNDGLSDQQALSLGLSPTSYDTDSDGIDDIIELGNNVTQPIDSDHDSIIDALEYGNSATDAQVAHGLTLISSDMLTLRSESDWFITKVSNASMETPVDNTTDNNDIVNTDSTLGAPGLNYFFGHIDFELSLAEQKQHANVALITLELSSDLPEKLVVYSLEKTLSGNIYSLVSEQHWQRLSNNSLVVTLYNDDVRDLNEKNHSILAGSIAIAENTIGNVTRKENGGSIGYLISLILLSFMIRVLLIKP